MPDNKNIHTWKLERFNHFPGAPVIGALKTIRSSVSSNDSSNPAVGSGQAFDGFKSIELEVKITGTAPSWNITLLLLNADEDTYMTGVTTALSGAKTHTLKLEVDGNMDVNFLCNGALGVSPVIAHIKARGIN